jgi:hypothetical protein
MEVRKNLTEAGSCFGAFFRGAAPESIADQARRQVGGEMFAQLALDVRDLVISLRSSSDG